MLEQLGGTIIISILIILPILHAVHELRKNRRLKLPPGPAALPFIGNVHQIPSENSHLTFTEWGRRYGIRFLALLYPSPHGHAQGPIVHLSILGKSMIVLNTAKAALDVLEKKGAIYADRPRLVMAGEIVGYEKAVTLAPYDNMHRQRRRLIHEAFSPKKLSRYDEFRERRVRQLLYDLLDDAANFQRHIHRRVPYVAALVFNASHGHEVRGHDDLLVLLAEQCGADFSEMVRPGAYLVDVLPFLRSLPDWYPFANFKRKARLYRTTAERMRDIPFDFVREQLRNGAAKPSLTTDILEAKPNRTPEEDLSYRWLTATIYAGVRCIIEMNSYHRKSTSLLNSFILTMALNTEVQHKAQAELDQVLGPKILPSFADRDSLPYIRALCLEILRLYYPTPTGLPHLATEDDEYMGYQIPAGAIVIANTWGILRDPTNYAEPEKLLPERFLTSNFIDPRTFAFGYGRRVCPGGQFAEEMIFMAVATILSVYDITGGPAAPSNVEFTSNLVMHPKPFKCIIRPRSPEVESFIKDCRGFP
ncbi:O-methylsterigmatocystin oxidoreductase [Leucoagaricus sp. SymC.cos]|nr:O-methylsterigmatocystin oxidoreductase [Leucoagaricus sp. SymC.cos]